jgi:hypothetical protein
MKRKNHDKMVLKAYEGPNPVCWYLMIRLRSISIVVWLVIKFTHANYKNISSYKWSHYRYLYPPILFTLMTARHMGSLLSWSYGSWIYSYLCNQCLLPLTLWVRIPLMARCTRYNIMWSRLSVTCDRSVVFSRYSGFLHQ